MDRRLDQRVAALAAEHGGLLPVRSAIQAGISYATLRWAANRGHLRPIWRGVYVTRSAWDAADVRGRHLLVLRAGQLRVPGAVAVAESAAVVLGLPLPNGPPSEPRLLLPRVRSRGPGGRGHEGAGLGRRADLPADDVWAMPGGLRVTAPGRTVVDCARHLDLPWSLAVGTPRGRDGG